MLRLGRASSRYATLGKIQDELDWVRMFYMKLGLSRRQTFLGGPIGLE